MKTSFGLDLKPLRRFALPTLLLALLLSGCTSQRARYQGNDTYSIFIGGSIITDWDKANKAFFSECERVTKKNGYIRYEVLSREDYNVARGVGNPSYVGPVGIIQKNYIQGTIKCFK